MINLTNDTIKFSPPIMNDRIKELESQCWETHQLTADANSWHTSFNSRKFAELIVRECIGVIGDENYTMLTGKAYCTQLKRHFGVEE